MTRRVVIVDCETTGLDRERHRAVEVAWKIWQPAVVAFKQGRFIPVHAQHMAAADPQALEVNGYYERIMGAGLDADRAATQTMHCRLTGATLVGSNPSFDADMLRHLFREAGLSPVDPWHHRMLDVSSFVTGFWTLPPGDMPGLADIASRLGTRAPDHTAWGDVLAVEAILDKLYPEGDA